MENTNKIILEKLFHLENKIDLIDKRISKIENEKSENGNYKKIKIKIISLEDKLFLDMCKINYEKLNSKKNKIVLKKEFIDLEESILLQYFYKNSIYGDYKIIKEKYLDTNYIIFSCDKYYYWDGIMWRSGFGFLEIIINNLYKTYCKTNNLTKNPEKYLLNQKHIFNFKKKVYNNKLKNKILSFFN